MRYRSSDEDSGRWDGFEFRPGDIVISTRSKSGTTWMQMICALLVFRTPLPPRPLSEISPWLDWLGEPIDEVRARLLDQDHRRFIKTHTPLDGLPLDDRATFIVVGRHPLDAAVSLFHQSHNLDRDRMQELTGSASGPVEQPELRAWLRQWIDWGGPLEDRLDSLPGVLWHLDDAWSRRNQSNILLVHYDDLQADLPGEMQRLARALDVDIERDEINALATAASFNAMRSNSDVLAPGAGGVLKDRRQFFRRGRSGAAAEVLTDEDRAAYLARASMIASSDMLAWLHRARRPGTLGG